MPQEPEVEAAIITSKTGIWIAIIGLIGGLLIAISTPFVTTWANKPEPTPVSTSLAIEQIPQRVFAYYGEAENAGGFAKLDLIYDGIVEKPSYELAYNLPIDRTGYAGVAFQFDTGSNLSEYEAFECTVEFSQLSDVVDLYFKDIAGNFNTIRVSNNGANEMTLRYEFTNFPTINFNAVKEFGIVVSTDFTTGSHKVRINNVLFVK